MDTSLAAMQAMLTNVLNCNNQRKFYAPSDARKDGNGCVSQGSYEFTDTSVANGDFGQLRMVNSNGGYGSFFRNDGTTTYLMLTNANDQYGVWNGLRPLFIDNATGNVSINTALTVNGNLGVNGTSYGSNSAGGWGGVFSGNGGGLYAAATSGAWTAGAFDGGTGALGLYTNGRYGIDAHVSTADGWAGAFNSHASPNGVWIGNNANNAQLCLNGTCTTSLNSAAQSPNGIIWGGSYFYGNYGCMSVNAFTGGCSCPSGYSQFGGMSGTSGGYIFYLYQCYKGTFHS